MAEDRKRRWRQPMMPALIKRGKKRSDEESSFINLRKKIKEEKDAGDR